MTRIKKHSIWIIKGTGDGCTSKKKKNETKMKNTLTKYRLATILTCYCCLRLIIHGSFWQGKR